MSGKKLTITTLSQLLQVDTAMTLDAERQLNFILPKWIEKTDSLKLKATLQKYLDLVSVHIDRLESFMESQKQFHSLLANDSVVAIIEETDEKLSYCTDREVINASLLSGVQLLNHYKICAYGTAAAYAKRLDLERDGEFFHEAEVNEKHIDDRLSQLAEFEINPKARAPIVLTM
jgi:ferritin-like metal-binding protein YciE